jgi:ribonuclease HII
MSPRYERNKIKQGYTYVIGCDEVGKGSLAGPVVAASVIMKLEAWNMKHKIKDSKLLSAKRREELDGLIKNRALAWAIEKVNHTIIDKINIHQATLLAMRKSLEKLLAVVSGKQQKVFVFVDGQFKIPGCQYEQEPVVDGDNKVLSVAAASIIAKVYRDRLMTKLHKKYPIYNFAQHKGYGTLYHRQMIIKHGLSPVHRLSFCNHLI